MGYTGAQLMCHGWVGVRRKEETDSGEGSHRRPPGGEETQHLCQFLR